LRRWRRGRPLPPDLPSFPLPPKPGQLEFARALAEHFASPDGVLLAEGYNGLGKTLASLYALKAAGARGVIAVRTYEEAGNFYSEGRRLGARVAVLLSKSGFCTNPRVAGLPGELFYRACLESVSRGECNGRAPAPLDAPDFASYARAVASSGSCPFASTLRAVPSAEAAVVTYPYVTRLTDRFSKLLGGFGATLYDEAHNLVWLYAEAEALFASDLASLARATGNYHVRLLAKHLSGSRLARGALEDAAWELSSLLSASVLVRRDHVLVYREPKPLLLESTAMMSGFIPGSVERMLTSMAGRVRRFAVEAPPQLKVRTLVVDDLDSSYERREDVAPAYREIVEAFAGMPGRKAVFYASKRLMSLVGVPRGALRPTKVFVPPASGDYLVADVLGGVLSEGSNVPFDAVLVVGFPYPEPSPALRFALGRVRERHGEDVARGLYEDMALCRVIQALGRLTRTGGWAVVADSRALRYRYPSWVSTERVGYGELVAGLAERSRNSVRA